VRPGSAGFSPQPPEPTRKSRLRRSKISQKQQPEIHFFWGDDRLLCSWCLGEARLTDRPEDMQVMTPEAWGRRFSAGRGGKRAAQAEAAGEANSKPMVAFDTRRRKAAKR
jgi:hypothetical protein